jgi:hypothetical protein
LLPEITKYFNAFPKQASEIWVLTAVKIDKEIFNKNGLKEPRK